MPPKFSKHKSAMRRKMWQEKHHHYKRRHWGLRRRLTFMFAFVALVAVALTTWLTLGAVFSSQEQLFSSGPVLSEEEHWKGSNFEAGRDAFRRVTRVAFFAALLSFFFGFRCCWSRNA